MIEENKNEFRAFVKVGKKAFDSYISHVRQIEQFMGEDVFSKTDWSNETVDKVLEEIKHSNPLDQVTIEHYRVALNHWKDFIRIQNRILQGLPSYWLFTVSAKPVDGKKYSAEEIYTTRMNDCFWGLKKSVAYKNMLREGDKVAFYLAEPTQAICGVASLSSAFFELDEQESNYLSHGQKKVYGAEYGVRLENIILSEVKIPFSQMKSELSYTKSFPKEKVGLAVHGSIKELPEGDYKKVLSLLGLSDESSHVNDDENVNKALDKVPSAKKPQVLVTMREGGTEFRKKILESYGSTCPFTNSNVEAVLEAAHIMSYASSGPNSNIPENGILMRADIHLLFDKHFIQIRADDYKIFVSEEFLGETKYMQYHGQVLSGYKTPPSKEMLRARLSELKTIEKKRSLWNLTDKL